MKLSTEIVESFFQQIKENSLSQQKKPSKVKIEKALALHNGNKTEVCKALDISYGTLVTWGLKYTEIGEVLDQQHELNLDLVESRLLQRINGFEEIDTYVSHYKGEIVSHEIVKKYPPDPTCIIFFLKTRGRSRGYVEKVGFEVTGKTVSEIVFKAVEPEVKKGRIVNIDPAIEVE